MTEKSAVIAGLLDDIKILINNQGILANNQETILTIVRNIEKIVSYLKAKSDINAEERIAKIERMASIPDRAVEEEMSPKAILTQSEVSEFDRMLEERESNKKKELDVRKAVKIIEKNRKSKGKSTEVDGYIKIETPKALQISVAGNTEWYPKSTIHSTYDVKDEDIQSFMIDRWILKKNKVIE